MTVTVLVNGSACSSQTRSSRSSARTKAGEAFSDRGDYRQAKTRAGIGAGAVSAEPSERLGQVGCLPLVEHPPAILDDEPGEPVGALSLRLRDA